MSTKISVIMSVYNEEPLWLMESLNSILNQSCEDFEFIIILDNPKNKELLDVLNDYKNKDNRIRLFINKENYGLVKSLNIAIKRSSGEYIARMDADDISHLDRLEKQLDYIKMNQIDFVFSDVNLIDETSCLYSEGRTKKIGYTKMKKILPVGNVSKHPTWFLKRTVFDLVGMYREIPSCEDYDFLLRCLTQEIKIEKMNSVVLNYRYRQTSISRVNSLEQYLNTRETRRKYKNGNLGTSKLINEGLKVTENQKKNFSEAVVLFENSLKKYKEKKIFRSIIILFRSLCRSRFMSLRLYDLIVFKIYSFIIL